MTLSPDIPNIQSLPEVSGLPDIQGLYTRQIVASALSDALNETIQQIREPDFFSDPANPEWNFGDTEVKKEFTESAVRWLATLSIGLAQQVTSASGTTSITTTLDEFIDYNVVFKVFHDSIAPISIYIFRRYLENFRHALTEALTAHGSRALPGFDATWLPELRFLDEKLRFAAESYSVMKTWCEEQSEGQASSYYALAWRQEAAKSAASVSGQKILPPEQRLEDVKNTACVLFHNDAQRRGIPEAFTLMPVALGLWKRCHDIAEATIIPPRVKSAAEQPVTSEAQNAINQQTTELLRTAFMSAGFKEEDIDKPDPIPISAAALHAMGEFLKSRSHVLQLTAGRGEDHRPGAGSLYLH